MTYHVTTRGNRGEPVFADDFDRHRFLLFLAKVVHNFNWACHAYCLLTTHYHLIITTNDANIGSGMHVLNGRYAQSFNRRHGVSGHVFEDRYYSVVVERNPHLFELIRYVALNPVRAGLCRAAEEWHWSSYASTIGLRTSPSFLSTDFVLDCFAADRARAVKRLAAFVRAAQSRVPAAA